MKGVETIPRLLGSGARKASYRPIRMISYAVDYTLNWRIWRWSGGHNRGDAGLNPLGYHISNLAYHQNTP